MTDEEWRPVPSKPGIMASSWGRVLLPAGTAKMPHGGTRSYATTPRYGAIGRSHKKATHVYRAIYCRKHGGNMKVHRLVCEAFHGPCPPGHETLHIDENGLNNRADNLKWGTRKENLNMPLVVARFKARTGENSSIRIHQRRKAERDAL